MSIPAPEPGTPLGDCISDFLAAVTELETVLPLVNEPGLRTGLTGFIERVGGSELRRGASVQGLERELNGLWDELARLDIRPRDPVLGPTPTLGQVEQATGLVWVRLSAARRAAAASASRRDDPEIPNGLVMPRAEVGRSRLVAMERALYRLEERVGGLETRGRTAGTMMQQGLIASYVGSVRNEVNLVKFNFHIGDNVDFSAVGRAIEAIVGLTEDFLDTLRSWGAQVAPAISRAAEAVRRQVRTVVSNVRAAVQFVLGKRSSEASGDPPSSGGRFNLREAIRMIVAGQVPPLEWHPYITSLSLAHEPISDLAPLAGLSALQSLDLSHTPVADLAPLAGLSALQSLDLTGTAVADLAPLAGLSDLVIRGAPAAARVNE